MRKFIDLTGKNVVVFGASGTIGEAICQTINGAGAKCILTARNKERLYAIKAKLNDESAAYTVDVNEEGSIDELARKIVEDNGNIDGLVYCVGVTNDRPLNLLKPEVFNATIKTNLSAFIECVRQFTKKNRYNSGMRIVGVSSVSSVKGKPLHTAYAASKAGMDGAIRCLSKELADKKIAINSVMPSMVNSEMFRTWSENVGGSDSEAMKELLERQYLGIAEPDDVANVVTFLISPAARFITGISLPVDGGMTTS